MRDPRDEDEKIVVGSLVASSKKLRTQQLWCKFKLALPRNWRIDIGSIKEGWRMQSFYDVESKGLIRQWTIDATEEVVDWEEEFRISQNRRIL